MAFGTLADATFLTTVLLCISLGTYYKKIEDITVKKNYGAGLGLLVACVICGDHMVHSVFLVWGNIIIIKCCDKKYVHQVSMAYSWIYLFYLHYNLGNSVYVIWLLQVIALRLVGLAFDTHEAAETSLTTFYYGDSDRPTEPTAVDIIAYSYFFVGLHKGPYYRYKVFEDHFKAPFGVLGDCRIITEHKIKKALVCASAFVILHSAYSAEAYFYDEFYKVYGTDTRYLYSVPQLLLYFLQWQVVMMLCTSVCTEAGFGVYPAKCTALPGYGPSTAPSLLKLASTTANVALQQEYNFAMLKCFDNEKLFFGPLMKQTLAGWDISTNFWFRHYIYKVVRGKKEFRSAMTFVAWWVWSDPSLHRLMMVATLCIYLLVEDEYVKLCVPKHEVLKFPWTLGFSIMRIFCLLYLTPSLILKDTASVMRYYNSMYWVYHIIMFFLILGLFVSIKMRQIELEQ